MRGYIDISQLHTAPADHELETARFFAAMGKNVTFITPSNIPGVHRPDILMDGVEWEIKSPEGNGRRTIEKNYHTASRQSRYIIFDLRRVKLSEEQCLSELKREFADKRTIRLLIITKSEKLIEYPVQS